MLESMLKPQAQTRAKKRLTKIPTQRPGQQWRLMDGQRDTVHNTLRLYNVYIEKYDPAPHQGEGWIAGNFIWGKKYENKICNKKKRQER
jgi:hypothetical protein